MPSTARRPPFAGVVLVSGIPIRIALMFSARAGLCVMAAARGQCQRTTNGIELNPEYVALAEERIATMPRCLMPKTKRRLIVEAVDDGLFAGM